MAIHVDGTVKKGYERILESFRENFVGKWEPAGSALAVYHKGELIVDLWGGYADVKTGEKWKENTLTVTYSTSKAVMALCVAMMVDRNYLDYDQFVGHYWPEYAQNGKENTTVSMLISHEAGLPVFHQTPSEEHVNNTDLMMKLIEEESPWWNPGEKIGYHLMTYGWLVDGLIRKADPQHRSCTEFYTQEIQEKYNTDWYCGLPTSEQGRVATVVEPSWYRWFWNWTNPEMVKYYWQRYLQWPSDLSQKIWREPQWMFKNGLDSLCRSPLSQLQLWAANGIGTARGLGKVFNLLSEGRLVRNVGVLKMLQTPVHINARDDVAHYNVTSGYGFQHSYSPTGTVFLGHSGYGGQMVKVNCADQLTIAYVTNGLTTESGAFSKPYKHLEDSIFSCFYPY